MTEPIEPTDPTESTEPAELPMSDEKPPSDPEPPTPEAPPAPDPIAWEPQTWYEATAACTTPGCIQENVILHIPMLYSNNGDPKYIRVVCGSDRACGKDATILTATKLDPQPPEE
ncbi:hypothetical protein [Streptomyces sp. PU_AKi4]|uniref:hypothetical protein n=1 Tax=Streptomyces sp. PU_AKi4 TaxID=2800809 RepID=UPI0035256264